MSEVEQDEPTPEPEQDEPHVEPEPPEEEPQEPLAEPQEGEPGDGEAEDAPAPVPTEPTPQGASQEEIEAAFKKLAKLDEHVARRVGEIMGDESLNLIRCPVCTPVAPGWIYPPQIAPLEPEQIAGMRALMGIQDAENLAEHPAFKQCPDCLGEGRVKTGSHRDGYESAECPTCAGLGYKQDLRGQIVANGPQPAPLDAPLYPAEPIPAELPADLAAYKAKGWLIAPPMQTPA
jgi:hypothetical protein